MPNKLYYGDNLDILPRYVADESVDLVYLDPPFNSDANYNILFAEQDGTRAAAQIKAFGDTWRWDPASAATYQRVVEAGGRVSEAMQAFRTFLGVTNNLLAYLTMMAPRLVELKRVLRPTGSIYLHCDPTASHYLKMLMDAVFEPQNFQNEIVWRRTGSHNSSKRFGPIHDTLLFYRKTPQAAFARVYRPYLKGHVESYFKKSDGEGRRYWTNALTGAGVRKGESGLPWREYRPTEAGRHWAIPGKIITELGIDENLTPQEKLDALDSAGFVVHPPKDSSGLPTYFQYLDRSPGMPTSDIWAYQPHTRGCLYGSDEGIDEDVRWLVAQGDAERLGYPTQKPLGLLERIISSSCPPGGVVLDPFCGCGTAVVAAQQLGRPWIGVDITHLAVNLIKYRMKDAFGAKAKYDVVGEPVSVADAAELAGTKPDQFQYWALGLVPGARPAEIKKGADKGIDGRLYFHDEDESGKTKQVIFSVKSGRLHAPYVRDLRGVIEREKAEIGVLISMQAPTQLMKAEAASAGFYDSPWGTRHPRLQLLTVEELLSGKRVDMPPTGDLRTFKKARKAEVKQSPTQKLFDKKN